MVRSPVGSENWFDVGSGVQQDTLLSALLFILFADRVMREVYENDETSVAFVFVDDVGIIR